MSNRERASFLLPQIEEYYILTEVAPPYTVGFDPTNGGVRNMPPLAGTEETEPTPND